jgi:hypothetical protein
MTERQKGRPVVPGEDGWATPPRGRCYLAGPFSRLEPAAAMAHAAAVSMSLRMAYPDLLPLCPHTHWGALSGALGGEPLAWGQVMRECLAWLEACPVGLIRFAGPDGSWASHGADVEEAWARGLGLPVRYWRGGGLWWSREAGEVEE